MPKPDKSNPVENFEHRSAYGDMHAHREAQMMTEHVVRMRSASQVDEKMATELLKPLHKKRDWTAEYLSTLPTYTDQQPEMDTFETAEKHRRKRDKEQLKLIEDFEAGRIDEHGNRLVPDSGDGGSEHGSVVSQLTNVSDVDARIDARPNTGGKIMPMRPRTPSLTSKLEPSASPSPEPRPSPEPAPSSARPSRAQPKRKRKKSEKVDPVAALPGGLTYEGYSYNELVAVGRVRKIRTPGGTDRVRDALIQDDINIAQGLERDVAPWKEDVNKYKTFKTGVPEELKATANGPMEEDEGEE
ncbi:hypothetical protein E8E12_011258 [Didymella heteroderae]|uniref:Uncharacterized protein n=1 Tax=Didymella heteroderae TaxID=1769908 RepID=A0A9P4X0E1_9PLEO|nr:hypothetical protein E8E12_011258 [Didymella heteroderae]